MKERKREESRKKKERRKKRGSNERRGKKENRRGRKEEKGKRKKERRKKIGVSGEREDKRSKKKEKGKLEKKERKAGRTKRKEERRQKENEKLQEWGEGRKGKYNCRGQGDRRRRTCMNYTQQKKVMGRFYGGFNLNCCSYKRGGRKGKRKKTKEEEGGMLIRIRKVAPTTRRSAKSPTTTHCNKNWRAGRKPKSKSKSKVVVKEHIRTKRGWETDLRNGRNGPVQH